MGRDAAARVELHCHVAAPLYAAALVAVAILVAQALIQGAAAQDCGSGQLCADRSLCCSKWNYCGIGDAYCGKDCQNGPCYGAPKPPPGDTPGDTPGSGGSGWTSFFTKSDFEGSFPNRNAAYTYEALTTAASAYGEFGTTGSPDDQRREVAAFLANIKHESEGLQFVKEQNPPSDYCSASAQYPCAPGKRYYGRGPIQLSYNYNYGEAGKTLGLDLLNNPDLVAQDGTVAFKTAFWFWMTRGVHGAITGNSPSFGQTIRIINGIECGHGTSDPRVVRRVKFYEEFCQKLKVVDKGTELYC